MMSIIDKDNYVSIDIFVKKNNKKDKYFILRSEHKLSPGDIILCFTGTKYTVHPTIE